MVFNIVRIAVILLYIFIHVDSAPYKSKNDVLEGTNSFPEKLSRINRDVSFGFPSLGFQIRSSFPVTNVIDILGGRKNENNIPAQQEQKSERNIPNYGLLTKVVDKEPIIAKEIIKEVENVGFYTTIATTTEYMFNTETSLTETEEIAVLFLVVFIFMVHSKSLIHQESKNETISSNNFTSSYAILTNKTSTEPSHMEKNSTTIDNSGLSDRIVLSTCVFLSCIGR